MRGMSVLFIIPISLPGDRSTEAADDPSDFLGVAPQPLVIRVVDMANIPGNDKLCE